MKKPAGKKPKKRATKQTAPPRAKAKPAPEARQTGRPTAYEGQITVDKLNAMTQYMADNPAKFLSLCTLDCVAVNLNIHRDTVREWAKKHEAFSDALKKWTTTRDACLLQLAKALPPGVFIFMTKNMLGWRDDPLAKKAGSASGSGETPPQNRLIIEVVQTKQTPPAGTDVNVTVEKAGQGR